MNSETKTCQNCKQNFVIEPEDFNFYKKIDVPPPTWCWECRYRRRLLDRNEWSLYRRRCDFTGENIISIYRQNAPFPVYKQEVWRGDAWDPLVYGRDFDFSRPFFEQYDELRRVVPHLALVNSNSVNSEYSNQSQDNKDCYMVSATGGSEKCMYGNWYQPGSFFSADCYMIDKSEFCYECINCGQCSNCVWCEDCFDCVNCSFAVDCRGCQSCFGCVGLRNKQYRWFNEQLTKEDYYKRIKDFGWGRAKIKEAREKLKNLAERTPRKYYHGAKIEKSTGDYLKNVSLSAVGFNCRENRHTAYLQDVWQATDCWDCTEILRAELSYELQGCAFINRGIVLRSSWNMTDCYYCDMCFSCGDCLGCFGLKQKQYCILNKQYSKGEYEKLKQKIVAHMRETGEWGEYFPPQYSPFGYNESVAFDFFPLPKEKALIQGYSWQDKEVLRYQPDIEASDLPEKISEVSDDILQKTIGCISQETEAERKKYPMCVTAFRVHPLELQLYQKLNLPLPQKCFPCRRTDRFGKRNPRQLWKRSCECKGRSSTNGDYENYTTHFHGSQPCPNIFETAYPPESPAIVYCEQCYQSEVI